MWKFNNPHTPSSFLRRAVPATLRCGPWRASDAGFSHWGHRDAGRCRTGGAPGCHPQSAPESLDESCQMRSTPAVVLALLLACSSATATPCEELRLQIESKIKSAGVSQFTVTSVEASASAPGTVVGTCDRGIRKLMYVRPTLAIGGSKLESEPTRTAIPAKRSSDGIVTECKDGSVTTSGNCKK